MNKNLSLRANTIWNGAGSLVYLGCTWLITVLVAVLSPNYEAAGSLAVGMAVGNIFASVVLFRVRTVQVSDVEEKFNTADYIILRFITLFCGCIFCAIYSLATVDAINYGAVAGYCAFSATANFVDVLHGVDQKHNRMDFVGISQILRGITTVSLFSIGMVVFKNLEVALFLIALGALLVVIFYDVPRALKLENIKLHFNAQHLWQLAKLCFPGFLATLISTAIVSIPRQMFGLQFGAEALGIYATMATPCVVVQACISYLYMPIIGPLANAWHDCSKQNLIKLLRNFFGLFALILVVITFILLFFADALIGFVFGDTLLPYTYLLMPMIVCTSAVGLFAFCIDLLIIISCYKESAIITLVSLIVCLLLQNSLFSAYCWHIANTYNIYKKVQIAFRE